VDRPWEEAAFASLVKKELEVPVVAHFIFTPKNSRIILFVYPKISDVIFYS